jgi:RNA polymerase subunit RPABC4/transcription elongation factor Spt4
VNVLASVVSSGTSHKIIELGGTIAVLLWLALGFWTYRDAKRRIESPILIGVATLVGLFPPYIGPFIYMLFRPPEFIDDRRERELEIRAIESRLASTDLACPVCHAEVDPNFLVCPVCTTKLKQACSSCNAPLEPLWQICPFCETPMRTTPQSGAPPALGTRRTAAAPATPRRTRSSRSS